MPRPCAPTHPFPLPERCHLCKLYVTNKRFRALWDNTAPSPPREPLAAPRVLECALLGDVLDNRGCNCRGKWVRECDLYGRCTLGDASLGTQVCQDCPDYRAETVNRVTPDNTLRLDAARLAEGTAHFNCSILEYRGKTLLAYRTDWIGSTIHIAELDSDWQPANTTPVQLEHPLAEGGTEDPRLFTVDGQLWLSFTGARIHGHGIQATQLLAQLDPSNYQPWQTFAPEYAQRSWPMEKNWTYFGHDESLYCVYTIAPHKILRISAGQATPAYETTAKLPWAGGLLRGGAPPVFHNGEWYCFFHGAKDMPGKRLYSIGCYTFANKPPFAVTRIAPFPILLPEGVTAPPANPASIAFPCGAIRRDGQWVVSYGYQDLHCELAFYSEAKIERALERV